MVGHEAPSKNVAVWGESFLDFLEEEEVVPSTKKYPLLVVASVVNMVDVGRSEMHGASLLAGGGAQGVGRLFLGRKSRPTPCSLPNHHSQNFELLRLIVEGQFSGFVEAAHPGLQFGEGLLPGFGEFLGLTQGLLLQG